MVLVWICTQCGRRFARLSQPHSCQKVTLDVHFKGKAKAKELFDLLLKTTKDQVGKCQVISLPCCIHLYGSYDFLAVLPKKDRLEIRFGLERKLDSPRLKQSIPISLHAAKNCIDLVSASEINQELIKWLTEAYHLKDKQ